MDAGGHTKSALPWNWICEHLIGIRAVGAPILREVLSYVPEDTLSSSLMQRLALRYLEEAVSAQKIDASIIRLLQTLAERPSASSCPTNVDYSDLLLRVRIEVALGYIRARPRDWHGFRQTVDCLFPSHTEDAIYLAKRKQFVGLLQIRDEKKCKELLEAYPLNPLQSDIVKCIASEKAHMEGTFLDKLLQDEGESQEDFHSADMQRISVGSDDQTEIMTRHSNAESEGNVAVAHGEPVAIESKRNNKTGHKRTEKLPSEKLGKGSQGSVADSGLKGKKRMLCSDSRPRLRQRDQYGKAITLSRSVKTAHEVTIMVGSETGADDKDVSAKDECCYKCKRGGDLIHCDGCPIIVHRTCLGSDFTAILQEREWLCPLCLQKKAAEAVTKAREEEMAAKARVALFMAELNIEGANGKENCPVGSFATEVEDKTKFCPDSGTNEIANQKKTTNHIESIGTDKRENIEAVSEEAVHLDINLPEEVESQKALKEKTINSADDYHLKGDGGDRTKRIRGLIADDAIHGTPKQDDVGTSSKVEAESGNYTVQADVQQPQVADGDGHDGDIEESGDGDVENKYLKRKPMQKLREKPLILGRRKRVPWSKEEEDTLKEGVKRFSQDGTWGFKWTRILEFGHGKFHSSRTDVDLKDKWRNMLKGRPDILHTS